ncbi:hypothetical protein [Vibrio navarrensis]|nr:hypothetical protein [Vibrio navarrensis]
MPITTEDTGCNHCLQPVAEVRALPAVKHKRAHGDGAEVDGFSR